MAAQATVAKLNIMLGANTAVLASDIKTRAIPILEGFKAKVDSMSGGSFAGPGNNFRDGFKQANQALGAMHGNLNSIGQTMSGLQSSSGGMSKNLTIAAAALTAMAAVKFTKWGIKLAIINDEETMSRWGKLKDEWAEIGRGLGRVFLPAINAGMSLATSFGRDIKHLFGSHDPAPKGTYDRLTDPVGYRKEQAELARLASQKLLDIDMKKTEEMQKQARLMNEHIRQQNQAWMDMAKHITEELRTPGEILNQKVGELNFLANRGLITFETYSRAINKAADDFAGLGEKVKQFERVSSQNAALDRNTTAGFSAVRDGASVWEGIKKAQEQQAEFAKRAEGQRQRIIDAINKGGLKVKEVTF